MPIYEIMRRHGVFAPKEVAMLGEVFEDLLQTLGLVGRKDPMTEMVAKKLVELATAGMRDPARLKALTVQAFTLQQQKQQQQIKPERCRRLAEFLAASANQMTDLEDKAALQKFAAY